MSVQTLAEAVTDSPEHSPGEQIVTIVDSLFRQHTGSQTQAVDSKVYFHVHENFLQEIRDHFRGRA